MSTTIQNRKSLEQLAKHDDFINRHIGPSSDELTEMLKVVGANSLEDLIDSTVPTA